MPIYMAILNISRGDAVCGDDLDDVECGTIHASGSIPIQIDYYYFEFKVLEMKPNCDIIIGKLFLNPFKNMF